MCMSDWTKEAYQRATGEIERHLASLRSLEDKVSRCTELKEDEKDTLSSVIRIVLVSSTKDMLSSLRRSEKSDK